MAVLILAACGVAIVAGACGKNDDDVGATLPPILTTTTTTTVFETTTTVQRYYIIQPGDTLSKIAESFGVDINDLMLTNGITDPDHIEAGQEIEIPPARAVSHTLPPTSTSTTTA